MTEAAGPHLQSLSAHFFKCALLCVCVMHTKRTQCGHVVSPVTFLLSQRDTLQGGGRTGLTLCDKSFFLSQSYCLKGSPSPSIPLSLLFMLLRVSCPPRPNRPPPGRLTLLHSICILFLGPLISPWSFILVLFLISLYLPPSSCSPSSETMAPLRASRYASQSYDDNPVTLLQVNAQQREGERGGACGGRVCTFNSLRSKFDQVKLV